VTTDGRTGKRGGSAPAGAGAAARRLRQAEALRQNLKRRKEQARARDPAEDAGSGPAAQDKKR
jgi:hypothetical protein